MKYLLLKSKRITCILSFVSHITSGDWLPYLAYQSAQKEHKTKKNFCDRSSFWLYDSGRSLHIERRQVYMMFLQYKRLTLLCCLLDLTRANSLLTTINFVTVLLSSESTGNGNAPFLPISPRLEHAP